MGVILGYSAVKKQSQAVYNQFGETKWVPFTKENAKLGGRDCNELKLAGLGKFLVLAAMGESLAEYIPLLKEHRDRFDLVTCDKGFGVLLDHGIKPDYVQICDCNIPLKWLEPYVAETKGVKLLATCYANPEWTSRWLGPRYFYVNRDSLDTQKVFLPIMGKDIRQIPAGSNVSNAMVIFQLGVDERSPVNWAGYEEYFLVGYDYSWRPRSPDLAAEVKQGDYYAFNDTVPKRHYMDHRTLIDINGDIVRTSENLLFSAKWLYSYVTAYGLPVTNSSGRGLLDIPRQLRFPKAVEAMRSTPERSARVKEAFALMKQANNTLYSAQAAFENSRRILYG